MSVIESILKNLETLPKPQLLEVAHYFNTLNPKRRAERLAAIQDTAGCMSGPDGEEFEHLVRQESNRMPTDIAE